MSPANAQFCRPNARAPICIHSWIVDSFASRKFPVFELLLVKYFVLNDAFFVTASTWGFQVNFESNVTPRFSVVFTYGTGMPSDVKKE